ncbi:hypothetical protein IU501_17100 [Nocardia otitidiscaviarum]|uniref:hypothetical protein n=1 Tax=Nocardia otitidiscaviarum TaxID=1823 RepID=UPI0004A6CE6B|nr:hypothetical protein [Nocardia otitidiscaviarum]MBF6134715.1 hypothetical protein [Nocardia otitidiscaviarum]MBF6485659.1 hypothetical protein [Nocardia otitidiscaviarum]
MAEPTPSFLFPLISEPDGVLSPPVFDPGSGIAADPNIAESSDRMVQRLFEAGLQLHGLRAVFDRLDADPAQLCAAGLAVSAILDELDVLIREASLNVLVHRTTRPADGVSEPNGYRH